MLLRKPGEVVAIAQAVNGKRWWIEPMMVVKDAADVSVLYIGPGAVFQMPDRLAPLSRQERGRIFWDVRREGVWNLQEQPWLSTHALTFLYPEKYYAIRIFWSQTDWTHLCWYINFQRPYRRTAEGFETLDLALDILVSPTDLNSTRLKDRDEYQVGIDCGQITPTDVEGIARDRATLKHIASLNLEAFRPDWVAWRPRDEVPLLRLDPSGSSRD